MEKDTFQKNHFPKVKYKNIVFDGKWEYYRFAVNNLIDYFGKKLFTRADYNDFRIVAKDREWRTYHYNSNYNNSVGFPTLDTLWNYGIIKQVETTTFEILVDNSCPQRMVKNEKELEEYIAYCKVHKLDFNTEIEKHNWNIATCNRNYYQLNLEEILQEMENAYDTMERELDNIKRKLKNIA